MKKFIPVILSMFLFIQGISQKQIITLTFQAKDSLTRNAFVFDSIHIKNLTENCDTTLYGPVSLLTLDATWPVGIREPASSSSDSFVVMQNVPNPFQGSTWVRIFMRSEGLLNLAVYDHQGKNLSEYQNSFVKGWHLFGISTSGSRFLLLKVSDNTTEKTIKMVSAGSGNTGDRITCMGSSGQGTDILKSLPDATGFIFYLGNQLLITANVKGYREKILSDNPVSGETYMFEMVPAVFTCGSAMTINHKAGAVAPVNKTATYATVTNVTGEPSKCRITSNLGADHKATAKNDATEASAGWYWQFNRNTQGSPVIMGWSLQFLSVFSQMILQQKSFANTLRCIRE
jgi:hypothetical protein